MTENDFDSKEEMYMTWWLDEAIQYGFIEEYQYHPKPFDLLPEVKYTFIKPNPSNRRRPGEYQATLFRPHSYQADFIIYWNVSAHKLLYKTLEDKEKLSGIFFIANISKKTGRHYSVIDVKPNFSTWDIWRRFGVEAKLVYYIFNVIVCKVITIPKTQKPGGSYSKALFNKTFTPLRYKLTDKTNKNRIIHFQQPTIQDFIQNSLSDTGRTRK